jgi:hypothetical protein
VPGCPGDDDEAHSDSEHIDIDHQQLYKGSNHQRISPDVTHSLGAHFGGEEATTYFEAPQRHFQIVIIVSRDDTALTFQITTYPV